MPSSTHPVALVYHNKSRGEPKANVTVLVLTAVFRHQRRHQRENLLMILPYLSSRRPRKRERARGGLGQGRASDPAGSGDRHTFIWRAREVDEPEDIEHESTLAALPRSRRNGNEGI